MKINIIGSGFSSLAASCYLAKEGHEVNVFEKNESLGGRARILNKQGFTFDIGPSWYWMPDVFERFFNDFNKKTEDYYELIKLNPAYKVFFKNKSITIPDNVEAIYDIFEKEEEGAGEKLRKFLLKAEFNYEVAIKDLVYRPGLSPLELITPTTITNVHQFLINIRTDIHKRFKSPELRQILEFPVLFLGAKPEDTPSFYSFMNYADFVMGTWYPDGGMYSVVKAMVDLAESLGVKFHTNSNVEQIITTNKKVSGLKINGQIKPCDIVLSGADYHHSEQLLQNKKERVHSEKFWNKKTFAPSALLYFVGFDKKLENVPHHSLFFDEDFDGHAIEIYDKPDWPTSPLFYCSFSSITDKSVAPEGKEAGVFLIPLAPDLNDSEEIREKYFNKMINRLEKHTNQSVREHILFKESYCVDDFKKDYNSFKGNAYGMANTLTQTAFLRPQIKSKKVTGLYFTGQLTVPGPGVPPSLISGKNVSELIIKDLKNL